MKTQSQQGFVLVATLWLVAALAMLAAYIDGVAEDNVERAIAERQALTDELDRRSTEATLLYLLATNRVNHRGFILDQRQRFAEVYPEELPATGDGELWVTDVLYQGIGDSAFSVQDENGLVSINMTTPQLSAVLRHVGLDGNSIARFSARIRDYVDTNAALGLDGAEALDYERAGLPAPANWLMSAPGEARNLLGAEALLTPQQWRRLLPLLTIRQQGGYNFNTMAPEIMAAILGVDESQLNALLTARARQPILTARDVGKLTGRLLDIDELEVFTMPGQAFRFSLWNRSRTSARRIGILLTPSGERAPWRKDYEYADHFAQPRNQAARQPETPLFQPAELRADPSRGLAIAR